MYLCMHTCIYESLCTYVSLSLYLCAYTPVYEYICICIGVCTYVSMYMYVCVCEYVSKCLYGYMYVCAFVYVCIRIKCVNARALTHVCVCMQARKHAFFAFLFALLHVK